MAAATQSFLYLHPNPPAFNHPATTATYDYCFEYDNDGCGNKIHVISGSFITTAK